MKKRDGETGGTKLGDYRKKRRPAATNEPFGFELPVAAAGGTLSGAFVVHLHDATRRHYDLRLEVTLLYIANLACIPLHILACRVPRLEQADFFTLDFDVKQSELKHSSLHSAGALGKTTSRAPIRSAALDRAGPLREEAPPWQPAISTSTGPSSGRTSSTRRSGT